jgi:hypothetical protein
MKWYALKLGNRLNDGIVEETMLEVEGAFDIIFKKEPIDYILSIDWSTGKACLIRRYYLARFSLQQAQHNGAY